MTPAETVKPIVTLPPYNVNIHGETRLDAVTAEKIAQRILELGGRHGFSQEGRSPTAEEQEAFREGRLEGYHKAKPSDPYDRLIFIYTRGVVEQAFEEAGCDPNVVEDRRLVDTFLAPVREAQAAAQQEAAKAKFEAEVEAFFEACPQPPAVERLLRAQCVYGRRGAKVPTLQPMDWTDRLYRVTNPYGGATTHDAPYQPERSGYRLLTDKAVHYEYRQEAYADESFAVIPVEVIERADRAAAQRNLAKIARKLQTHNGFAGSGSTYGFSLIEEADGCYVLMSSRHSISD